jgi:uncharacterized protein YcbK (DUF882 family)
LSRTHYTEHFTRAELNCKCPRHDGAGWRRHPFWVRLQLLRLARSLEKMRAAHGGPIQVLSGYRCPAHNAEVHGAVNSQHKYARAADIDVPGKTLATKKKNQAKLMKAAESVPAFRNGGIGVYPSGALHVDRRGWRARWSSWIGQ